MTQALVELRSAVRPHLATLSAGDRILVAVSGGADSLALAGALIVEAKEFLITCIGVTIDHQLQDGSDIQARKVVNQLERIGFSEVLSEK
jgi:tRNA(Ile)-lysidine synthase